MVSDNDISKLILGFKIKHLRHQLKIPYQELSKQTGLSVSYLNDIEKGKKYPKPDKIRALATAFKIDYDDLVSMRADKKLLPVVELLNSGFFKYFPMEEFGINMEKLIDFFSNSPDKISAFISTILKMVRSYQIEKEHFYRIALRSYQDMHDNYFADIESAAADFQKELKQSALSLAKDHLINVLIGHFGITVDLKTLAEHKKLSAFRSYFNAEKSTFYLNGQLSDAQIRFLLAKEIGYHYLNLTERSYETQLSKEVSFDKLLSNFRASYFAAAFLMNEDALTEDIRTLSLEMQWKPDHIGRLVEKYQVTPETLLQRFTNILPKHFGIDNLFFIRIDGAKDMINYQVKKELHLSGLHQPYQNQLTEHLCHRWVSITSIKSLHAIKKPYLIDAQISDYWQTNNAYFCISIAEEGRFNNSHGSSVTVGLALTDHLKATFNFMRDPHLKRRTVNTTCEHCSIPDCDNRVAPPVVIERKHLEEELTQELKNL